MDILLEALETKGFVRTLAAPNLTALSGQEATFLAGGEYPVPVATGDEGVAIEYKPFGVELAFTPRVVDGDTINIQLRAAVSAIDSSNGISGDGTNADIVIYPVIDLYDKRTVEGMRSAPASRRRAASPSARAGWCGPLCGRPRRGAWSAPTSRRGGPPRRGSA